MNEISILIIISAMLFPLNLLCTFWIFRELMNLSGVTFRETIQDIGGTLSAIPTGRFHGGTRHRKRIIYNYLLEKSFEPQRTKVLFKRYLYSTVPGLLSVLLSLYIALFYSQNQKGIAVAGICILFVINPVLFFYKKIYRKNNPLDEEIVSVLEEKRSNYEKKSVAAKVRYIIVYTAIGAIFLSIYIFINLSIAQIVQGNVQNGNATSSNITVTLDHNNVNSVHLRNAVRNLLRDTYVVNNRRFAINSNKRMYVA